MTDINTLLNYSHNLNLLYVDDDAFSLSLTYEILKKYFTNIITAIDGQDGYEKFKNNQIDLIITDINMPKLTGLEMISKIRDIDAEVSVLVLSSYREDDFFVQSIAFGVDGYLLKPIDLYQLENIISKVVKKNYYKTQSELNLHFLNQYKEITNQSSIVSKTDSQGIITYVNDAFCHISGYTKNELIGKPHNIIRHPDNPAHLFADMWETIKGKKEIWKGIVRNISKNGKSYYVDSLIMPILDQNRTVLEYISLRNNITDIMNPKKQLNDAINNAIDPILIYIKLENFDETEAFYNSETIEILQNKASKYLENNFSESFNFDTIYQLGNGEYAFIIHKSTYFKNEKSLSDILKKHQQTIKLEQIDLDHFKYDIKILLSIVYEKDKMLESASLGIKKLQNSRENFIISNNLVTINQKKAKENMKIVAMIKKAIDNAKIISYFQPIVDNTTQKTVKYESLVRLIDEDSKVLTPFFFLEAAKKSDQYFQITNIVLEHSFSILKSCKFDHTISINLSALDIEQTNTRENILYFVKRYKQYASRLVFELLEDESIKDFNIVKQFILDVKAYGVKIAIDDFGAGYSNYERLLDYQPDILKIDGCLIRDIETCSYSLSAVKSIVTFAKEQNLQTIAEYIENEAIYKIVKKLGVDYSQGYYFGKPEPLH
jgi:PAS domain S-box-containing protein